MHAVQTKLTTSPKKAWYQTEKSQERLAGWRENLESLEHIEAQTILTIIEVMTVRELTEKSKKSEVKDKKAIEEAENPKASPEPGYRPSWAQTSWESKS